MQMVGKTYYVAAEAASAVEPNSLSYLYWDTNGIVHREVQLLTRS